MKNKENPMYECPSYNICSAPKCPLDPDIDERTRRLTEEEKCRAYKPTRERIGAKYPKLLPYKGLTKREYNGREKWLSLTPRERELELERLAKLRKSII